jgi:hypothetical protein
VVYGIARASIDDSIIDTNDGEGKSASILLSQVSNNMATLEDMLSDRMLFLDFSSNPNSSAAEKDLTNNVLRNEFTPGVQNKRGSAKSNKVFAAYQVQFLKATQFASAKDTANRHLATYSHGSGNTGSTTGGYSSTRPKSQVRESTKGKSSNLQEANNKVRGQGRGGYGNKGKGKSRPHP